MSVTAVRPGAQNPNGSARARNYQVGDYTSGSESYALFANADYKFTDRFSAAVGLRGTTDKSDVDLTYRFANTGLPVLPMRAVWWPAGNIVGSFRTAARQVDDKTWRAATYVRYAALRRYRELPRVPALREGLQRRQFQRRGKRAELWCR